ncbi:hypothetical protein FUAX_41540 (plasmid) [Fulvitalea axinellae]|uniref:Peptide-N-glycosidase F N-terminal domain-containing protein n=1 Tax=Fulvitalea axinellae TaxID=1182444 RepID=A0AAU9D241_9BACT|nr:hypothetical protein FUAX_41540 [Fulvitalea axinellae]
MRNPLRSIFLYLMQLSALLIFVTGCRDNDGDSDVNPIEAIFISSNENTLPVGEEFVFTVLNNLDEDITSISKIYIGNTLIEGNVFSPEEPGEYSVVAQYKHNDELYTSNTIQVNVAPKATIVNLFDRITHYTRKATDVLPVPENILKISNTTHARKITNDMIAQLHGKLRLNVTVWAACDNYDRKGHIQLVFVPTGEDYVDNENKIEIEIARFITPFMNRNISPDHVDYSFEIDNVLKLLKDTSLKEKYDFYISMDLNGLTSTGQKQVPGCEGRKETFIASIDFVSPKSEYEHTAQTFHLLAKKFGIKSYKDSNTDVLGEAVKTFSINTEKDIQNAKLYFITSSHGANQGGEEYNRREHFLSFDGSSVASFIPGGVSCEPFRVVNTQGNGIYGPSPRTDEEWASFSNWCPGDIIPIREFDLGTVSAGNHVLKIEIPSAQFVDNQGSISVSAYIQGETE